MKSQVPNIQFWGTSLFYRTVDKVDDLVYNKGIDKDFYLVFAQRRLYFVAKQDEAGYRYLTVRYVDKVLKPPYFDYIGLVVVDKGSKDYLLSKEFYSGVIKNMEIQRLRKAILTIMEPGKKVLELVEYNDVSIISVNIPTFGDGTKPLTPLILPSNDLLHGFDIVIRPFINEEDAKTLKTQPPGYIIGEPSFLHFKPEALPEPVVAPGNGTAIHFYDIITNEDEYLLVSVKGLLSLVEAGEKGIFPDFILELNWALNKYFPLPGDVNRIVSSPKIYIDEPPTDPDAPKLAKEPIPSDFGLFVACTIDDVFQQWIDSKDIHKSEFEPHVYLID